MSNTAALESLASHTTEAEFARVTLNLLDEFARRSRQVGQEGALREAAEFSPAAALLVVELLEQMAAA